MRYYGGKTRQSGVILKFLTSHSRNVPFYDLFCGGLSLTCRAAQHFDMVVANDLTPLKVGYEFLLMNPSHLLTLEESTIARLDKNHPLHYLYGTSGSFGGTYRLDIGSQLKPKDNTSARDYYAELNRSVRRRLSTCQRVDFHSVDYRDVSIVGDSVVYLDPPYEGTEHHYGVDCSDFDYHDFWDYCRRLRTIGSSVYVTSVIVPGDVHVLHEFGNTNAMSDTKLVMEKLVTFL